MVTRTLATMLGCAAALLGSAAASASTYDGSTFLADPGEVNDLSAVSGQLSPPNSGPGLIVTQTLAPIVYTGPSSDCFVISSSRVECFSSMIDAWLGDRADTAHTLIFGADARVHGGSGADVLDVNAADAYAWGDAGDDVITIPATNGSGMADGGPGDDRLDVAGAFTATLRGGPGNDRLHLQTYQHTQLGSVDGGSGDDAITVTAGPSALTVQGGAGADVIEVDAADASVDAGAGRDRVDTANGTPQSVQCGPGADRATVDVLDTVAGDCEAVTTG